MNLLSHIEREKFYVDQRVAVIRRDGSVAYVGTVTNTPYADGATMHVRKQGARFSNVVPTCRVVPA